MSLSLFARKVNVTSVARMASFQATRAMGAIVTPDPRDPGPPGNQPGMEQTTGLERAEYDALKEGKTPFSRNEPLRGFFGTYDKPFPVPSNYNARIVGCTGGAGDKEHDIVWFQVVEGKKYVCSECFQVFQLKREERVGVPLQEHH